MRVLVWLLIGYCAYVLFKSRRSRDLPEPDSKRDETETHKDPICGVYVAREDAIVGTMEGERIYFCSMDCLEKYRERLAHKP